MATLQTTIESILAAAVELPTPEERQAYIAQACGGDSELQKQVEQMLDNYFQAGSFLETPVLNLPKTIAYTQETKGQHIGSYTLLEKLGEGGMGTVWIAERAHPRQRVALKLIKPGMDSTQILRRFDAERQALALMSHHNIARMLDAGTTETGRPYFVMELVKGVPITKYCDEVHATIEERLRLFIPVCQAIQHAHQKGIIHRDIKPSNVLVCMEDGQPVPKVIDFGVAKALYQPLTEGTLHTAFNQIVGTLEYMSPEQAELNALDIDTRADIYALGVLLFELLTGSTPITREELRTQALLGMLKKIKESEPKKPSTRLSESKETLASVAASRRTDPRKLMKDVSGDLDWIVMKCLDADRSRRYETANALAREIDRHLANEPVEARAPSRSYRFRKFLVRNRWAVAAASLILLAMAVGIIGLAWGLREAEQGRQLAEQKEGEVKQALEKETKERKYAQAIADFVKDDFLALTSVEGQDRFGEGSNELGRNATLRELLDRATNKLDQRKDLDPRTEAELRWIIGVSYRYLGEIKHSISNLKRCVELRSRENCGDVEKLISARTSLAVAYAGAGEFGKALPMVEEAFKLRKANFEPDHPDTLTSMINLAATYHKLGKTDLGLPLVEEALKISKIKLGASHRDTLANMNDLAEIYRAVGKLDLALPLFEETLKLRKAKLGDEHLDTLQSMNNLALIYQDVGKLDSALPLLEETLKIRKIKLGADHLETLTSKNNLALAYEAGDNLDQALPLLEETLKQRKAKQGTEHPDTLSSMINLAGAYRRKGQLSQALPLLEEAVKKQKATLGVDHPDTLNGMNNLVITYLGNGKYSDALPLAEETLKLRKAKLGPHHRFTLISMCNLANCYLKTNRIDLALPLLEKTFNLYKSHLGTDHQETNECMNLLATAYQAVGKLDLALPMFETYLKFNKSKFGNTHPITLSSKNNLALCYVNVKNFDKALPILEETLSQREAKQGLDHPETIRSMNNLATAYLEIGKTDRALHLLESSLRLQKAKLGIEHPDTLLCINNLAVCYEKSGKTIQILPLLLEATHIGEKRNFQFSIDRALLFNLIKCYEELKDYDQAEVWKRKQLSIVKSNGGAEALPYAGELASLAITLLLQKKFSDAEHVLRECITIREKKQPDVWSTFNTKSMLGGALLGQKKYTEAEPLLLQGYEGMKAREKTIPPQGKVRVPEAIERLIQLYEQTNKPAEAAKWRAELEKLQAQQAKEPAKTKPESPAPKK